MNKQEIFQKVATAIIKQNVKSGILNNDGVFQCLYKDPDGCKCSIGHILPEDHIILKENPPVNVYNLIINYKELNDIWDIKTMDEIDFLSQMQQIHDWKPCIQWRGCFRDLGLEHELDVGFIDSIIIKEYN